MSSVLGLSFPHPFLFQILFSFLVLNSSVKSQPKDSVFFWNEKQQQWEKKKHWKDMDAGIAGFACSHKAAHQQKPFVLAGSNLVPTTSFPQLKSMIVSGLIRQTHYQQCLLHKWPFS